MSIVLLQAAIISTLQEITDIGFVDDAEGRTDNLPWNGSDVLPLWVVTVSGGQTLDSDDFPSTVSGTFREHQFEIKGYFPFNFDAQSGAIWNAYLDSVVEQLSPIPALDVCSFTEPPSLDENDYVMYGAADGAVLCHYSKLTFKAIEYYVPA